MITENNLSGKIESEFSCYPQEQIAELKEILHNYGNVHVHGSEGSGKSTLLRLLAKYLEHPETVVYVSDKLKFGDSLEGYPDAKILPPGLDPWNIILKKAPDAIIVDGDDTLKAKNGKQFPSGEPIDEEYLPYQHDGTLWELTNKHVQVLSAGNRTVHEMNDHFREYGMGAYEMNYAADVEISRNDKEDGTPWFDLTINDVSKLRYRKMEGMRSMLQSISKGNLPPA
jgi:nicotinamide riboside kinase